MATRNQIDVGLSGQTGTGSFVGSTSPTITTPVIAQINDASGNIELSLSATASAVNYLSVANAATGTAPNISAMGSDTDVALNFIGKGTSGVIVQGRSTNTSPPTGYIGEFISSNITSGSAVNLTTATPASVTSISLTAGDWNVWGAIAFQSGSGTSVNQLIASISPTNNALPPTVLAVDYNQSINNYAPFVGITTFTLPISMGRLTLAATTTVYLVAQGTFTVNTLIAYGFIAARRRS
jgi:hypothetical protein